MEQLISSDLDQLAEKIAIKLSSLPPVEKQVWNTSDCASYLKVSKKHFTDRVSKGNKFPAPIAGQAAKWYAGHVIEWARSTSKAV